MITLRQVEAFKAVMESGTMLRAAERMGLSQPAVSRLIGDLERGIGYPLFDRRKGRVVPRREAGPLYAEVERAFVGLANIADTARRIGRGSKTKLRIALLPIFDSGAIAKVVADLVADYPDVELSLEGRLRDQILEGVADARYDLAFSTGPVEQPGIGMRTIARTESSCVVPIGHPLAKRDVITADDLRDVDLITPCNPGPAWRTIERILKQAGAQYGGQMTTASAEMGYALVAAGLGVTFGVASVSANVPPAGTRFVAFHPTLPVEIVALHPAGRPPRGIAARLIEAYADALQG